MRLTADTIITEILYRLRRYIYRISDNNTQVYTFYLVAVETLGPLNETAYEQLAILAEEIAIGYLSMTARVLFISAFVHGGAML